MTLTVFRAGNSDVVALNPMLMEKYGIERGDKVEARGVADGILIVPVDKKKMQQALRKWEKKMKYEYGLG